MAVCLCQPCQRRATCSGVPASLGQAPLPHNPELDKLKKMDKAVKASNKYLWSPEIYTWVLILSAELLSALKPHLQQTWHRFLNCFCDFAGEWTPVWCMQDKSLMQSIRWTEMHTAEAQKQLVPNLWVGDVRCGRIMKNRITNVLTTDLITWFWTKRWTPSLLGITCELKVTSTLQVNETRVTGHTQPYLTEPEYETLMWFCTCLYLDGGFRIFTFSICNNEQWKLKGWFQHLYWVF